MAELIHFVDHTKKANIAVNRLFFIEEIGKNGSRSYRLIRSSFPCWHQILCKIKTIFIRKQHRLISHSITLQLLSAAANEEKIFQDSDVLTKLISLKNLQSRAHLFECLETPIHRKERVLKQGKEKFYQAVNRAKVIGKGICKIETRGYQPLILDSLYIKELFPSRDACHSVHFLSKPERSFFVVECCEGKLLRRGKIYDTNEGKKVDEPKTDAFVISPDEELYASAIKAGKFHHSSFLHAGAVIFAGELETNSKGKIIKITNRSGHYKPQQQHLLQALRWFQKRGIDLSGIELHEHSISRPNELFIHSSAEKYLNSCGICHPDQQIKF